MSSGGFKAERYTQKNKSVKKKRSQSSLSSFFTFGNMKKSKIVTTDLIDGGVKMECPYCFKFYSTQGFPNHVRKHQSLGEKLTPRPRVGKVKSIGPKYPQPVKIGVKKPTVDLTTDESQTVPIDLSTTVSPDTVSVDSPDCNSGGGKGVTRRNFTNAVSILNLLQSPVTTCDVLIIIDDL